MPRQMIGHERRDKIITVVVTRLTTERQRDAGLGARCFEQLGPQFLFDERVPIADVHEKRRKPRAVLNGQAGIALKDLLLE